MIYFGFSATTAFQR